MRKGAHSQHQLSTMSSSLVVLPSGLLSHLSCLEHPKHWAGGSQGKLTGDESKGDRVDTATTTTAIPSRGGLWPLRGADVHLEANGLLEDGGATTGLILSPEAGL